MTIPDPKRGGGLTGVTISSSGGSAGAGFAPSEGGGGKLSGVSIGRTFGGVNSESSNSDSRNNNFHNNNGNEIVIKIEERVCELERVDIVEKKVVILRELIKK